MRRLLGTYAALSPADVGAVAEPPPTRDAAYQRRFRERDKCGLRLAWAPYDVDLVQRLIDCGFLMPEDASDRHAIGKALAEAAETALFRNDGRDT
jgi:hypothetical protein